MSEGENPRVRGDALFSRRGTESEDMRLIRRSIRNGWPVSDEIRRKVMERVEGILDNSSDSRDVINASKVAIQADGLNAKREAMELDAEKGPEIHLHAHTGTEAARQVIESEPDYLEYLRNKALESGSSDS
jgi:hypothetical protein